MHKNSPRLKKTFIGGGLQQLVASTAIAAGGNGVMMLISAVSGIMTVRFLSTQEYAFFTIAVVACQALQQLADSGATVAAANEARKNWTSPTHLGVSIASGRKVRRKFYPIILALAALTLLFLLTNSGATLVQASLIIILIIPVSLIMMQIGLLNIPIYLHQRMAWLQGSIFCSESIKLVGVVGLVRLFPYSFTCLFGMALGLIAQVLFLRKGGKDLVDPKSQPDPKLVKNIRGVVKEMRPVVFYTCFSGYISVWLASFFGATEDVASVGGLYRLTGLMTLGATLFGLVIAPRYSRNTDTSLLRKRFNLSVLLLAMTATAITTPFLLFPQVPLFLLGNGYEHLDVELRIACIGGGLGVLYAGLHALALGRGNTVRPWTYLSTSIAWQVMLILSLDISSLQGILWVGTLTPLPNILFYFFTSRIGIKKEELAAAKIAAAEF